LFNSFDALAIEVSDLPVPSLNDIPPCNSNKVSRKRPSGVVIGNCPVKKKSRILSPIDKSATVIPPVVPVMDAESYIYSYLRSMRMEQCEEFAPVCSSKCSSSKPVEMPGHEPEIVSVPALHSFKTIHDKVLQQVVLSNDSCDSC
jgi:hypothetical protein